MSKRRGSLRYILLMTHVVISSGFLFLFLTTSVDAKAVLYIRPVSPKQYSASQPSQYGVGTSYSDFHFTQKDEVLTFEAADAIDSTKYSQPDVANSRNSGVKVPSSIVFKQKHMQTSVQIPSPANFQEQTFSTLHASEKNSLKPLRDTRHLDSAADEGTYSDVPSGDSGHNIGNNLENVLQTHRYDGVTTNLYSQVKNNFTDASDNLVSVSSDAVLSIEVSSNEFNDSSSKNSSVKQSIDIVNDVPSLNYSDFNPSSTLLPISKTVLPEYTTQISVPLNTHVYIDFINQTNVTDSIMSTSIFPSINNDENVTNSLPSTDSEKKLSSGTVAGIVIAVLVSVTLLSSAVIYLLYRKFNGKCTSVVESKFNTDNCGYLDDSLRSSIYLNNHIELPKESSEEMTSLDNDSFLNSLETMTIQNYWADNSKNTKV